MDEAGLAAALTAAAGQGFDLSNEIPLRAHLFEIVNDEHAGDEHVLLIVLHHIAGDGWSLGPLARDLAVLYRARMQHPGTSGLITSGLSPLPVQYADYTLWQQAALGDENDGGSALSRQLSFWTEALKDLPDQIELPADRPRPAVSSHRGGHVPLSITPELHRGLAGLARETGASLFMVLQAGLAGLLSRLGAGTDIAIGSPIAGRTDAALDDLIGFFVNTLVLRTDTSGQPSFRELIGRVRGRNLAAYGHQELPFERLVEVLNPARSLSRHPLFQVMLAFEAGEAGARTLELPGLAVTPQPIATASAKFDLSVGLVERRLPDGTPGGIDGVLEYASDLFDKATVDGPGPAPHPAAGGRGRGRRTAAGPPADPGERRARHHPAHLERHHASWAAGCAADPAGAVCRAGGTHAGCGCGGVRGPHAHATPRSTPTPTGWRIICKVWASAPRPWWGCAWSARPRWWLASSAFSRRAAPTCRSIRTIRASGLLSCWPTPAARCW